MSLDQNLEDFLRWRFSRRTALKAGAGTVLGSQALLIQDLAIVPPRPVLAASFSDIQFDIGRFLTQAPSFFDDGAGNVLCQFGPIFTLLAPARLTRNPTKADQTTLANALATIEGTYTAAPSGVLIASVSYGLPYFNRLPQALVAANMPRLSSNTSRFVLEESPAFPSDVVGGFVGGPGAVIPNVKKDRFNINVAIEQNDMLFQFRSDSTYILNDVLTWLQGSGSLLGRQIPSPAFNGLLQFQVARLQFVQPGMPRRVADNAFSTLANGSQLFEFHTRINPNSPMVMGFADQQSDSSASNASFVTFAGVNAKVQMTTAKAGDYFDNGSIGHLSHDIDDLYQFYSVPNQDANRTGGEPYSERVQYMFRSNQVGGGFFGLPAKPNTDEFANGGGAAFVNNVFQGSGSALAAAQDTSGQTTAQTNQDINATFTGTPRVGHEAALQRSSRAPDGTPLHIRNDGPGFDGLDVPAFTTFPTTTATTRSFNAPAGTSQFKLQFLAFVPTAEFFRAMRVNAAAQDFQHQFMADQDDDNGLERFITATRRQNFLAPPRRHRAFPLLELT